jgi:hypothetical protein
MRLPTFTRKEFPGKSLKGSHFASFAFCRRPFRMLRSIAVQNTFRCLWNEIYLTVV